MSFNYDNIVKDSDPIVREKSVTVPIPMHEEDKELLMDMLQYVRDSQDSELAEKQNLRPAVGIAAIQLGIPKRMTAIHVLDFDEDGNVNFGRENSETAGRYHSDWCSMMYSRLLLARNLLTEDGLILINMDENEISNLQKICGEIFGETNDLGTIVWDKRNPKGDARGISLFMRRIRQCSLKNVKCRDRRKMQRQF